MANSPSADVTAEALRAQFANPAEKFTLLFLVGGNVIQVALAQNAGFQAYEMPLWWTKRKSLDHLSQRKPSRYRWSLWFSPPFLCFTPVVFSFGWVSYAFMTLATVWGGETLLPKSTAQCIVVEGKSGHVRSNTSWVIGRMWQDYAFWRDGSVNALVPILQKAKEREAWEPVGLIVGIYRCKPLEGPTPRPVKGVGWLFALLVTLAQLGFAVIPLATEGEWGTLLVTFVGTLLAWWTAALPQWHEEKFRARKAIRGEKGDLPSVVITSGNGAQHAILVVCEEGSINLEDLATGQNEYRPQPIQGIPLILLTVL